MHQHSHAQHSTGTIISTNRVGAWVSIACAIHCAAMPFLLSVLPLLGMEFLASHFLEIAMLSAGLGFGAYGILKAYFQTHRHPLPVALLALGASLVISGMFLIPESLEPVVVPSGALLVGIAQVVNIRKSKTCTTC